LFICTSLSHRTRMDRAASTIDPCTLANTEDAALKHLELDWQVDFSSHVISGCALWHVQIIKPTGKLLLDTKMLAVSRVLVDGLEASFELLAAHDAFGSALQVTLPVCASESLPTLKVACYYSTHPESSACQWLSEELTAGKKHPYLFTQCQAIHARALMPCQDTPGSKFTYSASVTVPSWATPLMSAISGGPAASTESASRKRARGEAGAQPAADAPEPTTTFSFEQTVPIPSYLLALAVGELHSRKIGPRSLVWSEPSMVEAAAHEFVDVERFLQAAETITGQEYVWGQYDILCLPPSFPYGGMENPCLTFVTPTLLAGDRSLAGVVAHEVSHSWTGNLLTNRTWEHFWLNEGWTVWLERRIEAHLHGEKWYDFGANERAADLTETIQQYGEGHSFTSLLPDLTGMDPDDAFSVVPYEKGFRLLHHLSEVVGRDAFFTFVRAYIARFKFKTLTSACFRDFFIEWCANASVDCSDVDWDTWLHEPGHPPVADRFSNEEGERALDVARRWIDPAAAVAPGGEPEGCGANAVEGWRYAHWAVFLNELGKEASKLSVDKLRKMDGLYDITSSRNAEVRLRWQRLCLQHREERIVPHVVEFLKAQGRMKFVRPLYRDLFAWAEQRSVALATFAEWKANYHPIARKMLAKDLQLAD